MHTFTLVLLRHGESEWNRQNRFTGWTDVDLSEDGQRQAIKAGRLLNALGYRFDVTFTSVLKRAIRTLWHVLDQMDQMYLPEHKSWRLNERHYGNLQGLNKAETAAKFGDEQVHTWRRSYSVRPPPLDPSDPRHPRYDRIYAELDESLLPATESLQDCVARCLPYWHEEIAPAIHRGRRVLVAAHGNSLRGIVKHLDNISDEDIMHVEIPTGVPLVYELGPELQPLRSYYLGEPLLKAPALDMGLLPGGGALLRECAKAFLQSAITSPSHLHCIEYRGPVDLAPAGEEPAHKSSGGPPGAELPATHHATIGPMLQQVEWVLASYAHDPTSLPQPVDPAGHSTTCITLLQHVAPLLQPARHKVVVLVPDFRVAGALEAAVGPDKKLLLVSRLLEPESEPWPAAPTTPRPGTTAQALPNSPGPQPPVAGQAASGAPGGDRAVEVSAVGAASSDEAEMVALMVTVGLGRRATVATHHERVDK